MDKKEKEALKIAEICKRLPYGLKFKVDHTIPPCPSTDDYRAGYVFDVITASGIDLEDEEWPVVNSLEEGNEAIIKKLIPYVRPLDTMTDEEKKQLSKKFNWRISCGEIIIHYHSEGYWDDDTECSFSDYIWLENWLLKHHFDTGLIAMGIAEAAPEGLYQS